MSNQFVEIKSTVFKRIEKENLFQLTCADIVERFQLWLMLMIIAARNVIETNSLGSSDESLGSAQQASLLPDSFTWLPRWTHQLMTPFVLVLGTEMLVDWLKHAYITKFNNTKPNIYGRFLDVLAKDYYIDAFSERNLTRRIGLAVIPLSCLFIRASVQTYHMFLATAMPLPLPSTATSLSVEADPTSSPTTAALNHFDTILRHALGRAAYTSPGPTSIPAFVPAFLAGLWTRLPTTDLLLNSLTSVLFFLLLFLVLLILKLLLGMCLLAFARRRYQSTQVRVVGASETEGKRVGGWGVTELGEEKRRVIYEDDPAGARRLRERDRAAEKVPTAGKDGKGLGGVARYSMVAKRIW